MKTKAKFIEEFLKPNYISYKNSTFETNSVAGWTRYQDAAQASPVDGTGGTPSANLTIAATNTNPLVGGYSLLETKSGAANLQGYGWSLSSVAIPLGRRGQMHSLDLLYSIVSGTYTPGDKQIWLYDETNSELIYGDIQEVPSTVLGVASRFTINFPTKTTTASVRVIVHQATSTTNNYTISFDEFNVQPVERFLGARIQDWKTIDNVAALLSITTNFNASGYYRLVGDHAEFSVRINFTGANSQGHIQFTLPNSWSMDTGKMPNTIRDETLGTVSILDSGTAQFWGSVAFNNATSVFLQVGRSDTTYLTTNDVTPSGASPMTPANGDVIVFKFSVPIAGMTAGIALANSRLEYASNSGQADANDTTSFSNQSNGELVQQSALTAGRSRRVRFKNPILPGDTIQVQLSVDGGTKWSDLEGHHTTTGGVDYSFFVYQNGITYGLGRIINVSGSSTDVDVQFGRYAFPSGATFGAAGAAWATETNARWRVAKYSNSIPVESGAPEYQETVLTANTQVSAANTWEDVTGASITINPGMWDIGFDASLYFEYQGANPVGDVRIVDSAGNQVRNAIRFASMEFFTTNGQSANVPLNLVARNIAVAVQTTFKVQIRATVSSATSRFRIDGAVNQSGSLTDPDHAAFMWARKTTVGAAGNLPSSLDILSSVSSIKTPSASGNYQSMSGNSLVLPPGIWRLFGGCKFGNNGSSPAYSNIALQFLGANGADSSSLPVAVSTLSGVTVLSANNTNQAATGDLGSYNFTAAANQSSIPAEEMIVRVTSTVTVFLVPYATMTTAANARLTTFANAQKLADG